LIKRRKKNKYTIDLNKNIKCKNYKWKLLINKDKK